MKPNAHISVRGLHYSVDMRVNFLQCIKRGCMMQTAHLAEWLLHITMAVVYATVNRRSSSWCDDVDKLIRDSVAMPCQHAVSRQRRCRGVPGPAREVTNLATEPSSVGKMHDGDAIAVVQRHASDSRLSHASPAADSASHVIASNPQDFRPVHTVRYA